MPARVCIVGTAPTWNLTPWNDPGLEIWSLNNAYEVKGFQRADRWFDFHPLNKFYTPPEGHAIYAHQVPPGHYVRPKHHLHWLGSQTIPIYLHPDYVTQHPEAATWRHARPLPLQELTAHWGTYWMSGPSYMVAMAMAEGCTELWITGIHLSTEQEYIRQRPNFEMFLGAFLGLGPRTCEVKGPMRYYRGERTLVLPVDSPILQGPAQYPFEAHPDSFLEPIKWEMHKVGVKTNRATQTLQKAGWWQIGKRKAAQEDLVYLEAKQADLADQMAWEAQARSRPGVQ